jgi:hypothetical protein
MFLGMIGMGDWVDRTWCLAAGAFETKGSLNRLVGCQSICFRPMYQQHGIPQPNIKVKGTTLSAAPCRLVYLSILAY